MIERFNFYDIYGYLLPGGLLLAFIWMPLGVLTGIWPPAAWSSAIIALALAYVVGHILSALADAGLPSEFADKNKKKRYPSDLLFDNDDDQVLTRNLGGLRTVIADQIKSDFQIDVALGSAPNKNVMLDRSNAFLRCRNLLVRQKVAGYAEQQQGMYVVMRGTAAALLLACALYAGMTLGFWIPSHTACIPSIAMLLLAVALFLLLVAAIRGFRLQSTLHKVKKWPRDVKQVRALMFWLLAAAFFFTGLSLAKPVRTMATTTPGIPTVVAKNVETQQDPVKYREMERALDELRLIRQVRSHAGMLLVGWATVTGLLFLICLGVYRSFAVNFAIMVYRDYSNAHVLPSGAAETSNSD